MKPFAIIAGVVSVLFVAVSVPSCGGNGGCTSLCLEVKPKLVEQIPDISPEDVKCHEPPWTLAETCDECKAILEDKFDVSMTGDDICERHFD